MKIVVNRCFGGYSLSKLAMDMLGVDSAYAFFWWEERNSPALVKVVEELGKAADGDCADLEIIEIPDSATDWLIEDYDGMETVLYVFGGKIHSV